MDKLDNNAIVSMCLGKTALAFLQSMDQEEDRPFTDTAYYVANKHVVFVDHYLEQLARNTNKALLSKDCKFVLIHTKH
jgi:hypothetical protein